MCDSQRNKYDELGQNIVMTVMHHVYLIEKKM